MAVIGLLVAVATAAVTALLVNISERKSEARQPFVRLVEVDRGHDRPGEVGQELAAAVRHVPAHGASRRARASAATAAARRCPSEKIERDPWLKRMFLGYAFSIDYRDRRGHAYMLQRPGSDAAPDEAAVRAPACTATRRSCRSTASSATATRRRASRQTLQADLPGTEQEAARLGPRAPGVAASTATTRRRCSCASRGRASSRASRRSPNPTRPVPHLPSIERWRAGDRKRSRTTRTPTPRRTEMRSFVCGQCHVEYYCSAKMPLTFPWGNGLRADDVEKFWNETKFPDGDAVLRLRARRDRRARCSRRSTPSSSCGARASTRAAAWPAPTATCRTCATARRKVSDHWVRSPLLNVNRACQTCHQFSEDEITARVDVIQTRNYELLQRGGAAIVDADRRDRGGQGGRRDARAAARRRSSCSARHSGASTSSPPRTRWASTRRRKPRACSAKPSTTRGRVR